MAQVVVYGPNGARTTANTVLTEADKQNGFTMSEYDRLIAGQVPGNGERHRRVTAIDIRRLVFTG